MEIVSKVIRLFKDSIIIFSAQIGVLFLSLFATVIVARNLGPEGKGIYSLVFLTVSSLFVFLNMGIGSSNTFMLGKKNASPNLIVNNSVFITIILSTVPFSLIVFLPSRLLSAILPHISISFIYLGLISLPLIFLIEYFNGILLGLELYKKLSFGRICYSGCILLFLFIAFKIFSSGIEGAIVATILGTLAGVIFMVYVLIKAKVLTRRIKITTGLMWDTLKFGSKLQVSNMIQFFNYRLDTFIVNYFLSPLHVGLYTAAVSFAELIWHIPNAISQNLFVASSKSKTNKIDEVTILIFRQTLFLVSIVAVLFLFLGRFLIIILLGNRFAGAYLPFKWLLIGVVALSTSKVIAADMVGRGYPGYCSMIATISLVFTIVLDLLLIPRYGITGAAIASSISYTVSALLFILIFKRITKINLKKLFIPGQRDLKLYKAVFLKTVSIYKNLKGRNYEPI